MDALTFPARADFAAWLAENGKKSGGVWLLFGKKGGPATLSAAEALSEALRFGWIDGQMKSLGETEYVKYFAPRRKGSPWSEKNKKEAESLIAAGEMTPAGLAAVEAAKADGRWDAAPASAPFGQAEVEALRALLKGNEPAFTNFENMPPSVRLTYAAHYHAAKSEDTRARRLAGILARLHENKRPM